MHGLELGLLVLESVLLVATVILLVMSRKEGHGRDLLIIEMSRAVNVLSRHEYFITVTDAMMDSQKEVIGCITGRKPSGDDKKRTREVVLNIEKLASTGIKVRYIMPRFQDRLYMGWLYTKAGAECRYSSCQLVHDIRYTVVDEQIALLGIPESIGEREATKKGYKVPSEGLAKILKSHFYGCWADTLSYEEYLRETLSHTGATPEGLARELDIDIAELKRVLALDKPAQ